MDITSRAWGSARAATLTWKGPVMAVLAMRSHESRRTGDSGTNIRWPTEFCGLLRYRVCKRPTNSHSAKLALSVRPIGRKRWSASPDCLLFRDTYKQFPPESDLIVMLYRRISLSHLRHLTHHEFADVCMSCGARSQWPTSEYGALAASYSLFLFHQVPDQN